MSFRRFFKSFMSILWSWSIKVSLRHVIFKIDGVLDFNKLHLVYRVIKYSIKS